MTGEKSVESLPKLSDATEKIRDELDSYRHSLQWRDYGQVTAVLPGICFVKGLDSVGAEELVKFENGSYGIAFDISDRGIGCLLLSDSKALKAGMEVESTGQLVTTQAGDALIGKVIDPLANRLDLKEPDIKGLVDVPVESEIPQILDRSQVSEPLETGIKVIDSLLPIGKGQRELILGDRQTGKTSLAVDTIINQKDKGVICIYCSIGQRSSAVANVVSVLEEHDAMKHSIVLVAEGNDPPGIRYLAPYAATAIGEYFMKKGKHVLIVYDDLTNHARTYREISLLLRRPPGREAFPGDVFYIHSRLLERSTQLCSRLGGGSLTALPIIETQAQDISSYIPTNLISITDGQIYLSSQLFHKNILPPVDIGISVSRVGGKAQLPAFRYVTKDLKLSFAQFEELEGFSKFGTRIDPSTQRILEHGKRIRKCLTQERYSPLQALEQIMIFLALKNGLLDPISFDQLDQVETVCKEVVKKLSSANRLKLLSKTAVDDDDFQEAEKLLRSAIAELKESEISQ